MPDADGQGTVTIAALLDHAAQTLRAAGIDSPRAEARRLLAAALGVAPEALVGGGEAPVEGAGFEALVRRRAGREPLAYILGEREFWGRRFRVTPATLIPRPETETLIEAALDAFPDRARVRRVLDLGTGSGCLLCAALCEFPHASGLGVDASEAALAIARANAAALGLAARSRFVRGDWLAGIDGRFDLVLANPPYIARAEMAALAPELRFEPQGALLAEEAGFAAHRAILGELGRVLAPGGVAVVEVGAGQAEAVATLARAAGLDIAGLRHDLAGIPRAISLSDASRRHTLGVGKPSVTG